MLCLHYVKNRGPIIVIPSLIVILYSLLLEKSNEKSFVVVAILKKKNIDFTLSSLAWSLALATTRQCQKAKMLGSCRNKKI